MALSDAEELELLTLEREKAQGGGAAKPAAPAAPTPEKKGFNKELLFPGLYAADVLGKMSEHAGYKVGGKVVDTLAGSKDATGATMRPEAVAGMGMAANVATQALPMLAGGKMGEALESGSQKAAKWLMTSALKPDKLARDTGKGAKAVDTLLNTGTNVTEGGVEKLRGRINEINNEITGIITKSNKSVDKATVAKALQAVEHKAFRQANPQGDVATVRQALDEFVNHPLLKDKIPVQLAQQIKIGTYKSIGDKAFGELKGASIESQKALARGLKEEIAKAHPEVSKLNAEESELLNAEMLTKARVVLDQNKNVGGISWLATHPVEFLAMTLDRSPLAKSLLARAFHSGEVEKAAGRAAGAGVDLATQQGTRPTATNPKTGEKMHYVDGQWQPVK